MRVELGSPSHKDAIVQARVFALHALPQFQLLQPGSSLRSERNPGPNTFDNLKVEPKGGRAPNVIGHTDGHFRLLR